MNLAHKIRRGEDLMRVIQRGDFRETWNYLIDMVTWWQQTKATRLSKVEMLFPHPAVVDVANLTGADLAQNSVVQLSGSIIDPTAGAQALLDFQQSANFGGIVPTKPADLNRWAVMLDPVNAPPTGGQPLIGRAAIAGAVACQVNIQSLSDVFCYPVAGVTGYLQSGPSGPGVILSQPSGTGIQWCQVAVGRCCAPTAGSWPGSGSGSFGCCTSPFCIQLSGGTGYCNTSALFFTPKGFGQITTGLGQESGCLFQAQNVLLGYNGGLGSFQPWIVADYGTLLGWLYFLPNAGQPYPERWAVEADCYSGIVVSATYGIMGTVQLSCTGGSGGSSGGSSGGGGSLSRVSLGTAVATGTGSVTATLSGLTVPAGARLVIQVGQASEGGTYGLTVTWNGANIASADTQFPGQQGPIGSNGAVWLSGGIYSVAVTSTTTASITVNANSGSAHQALLISAEYVLGLPNNSRDVAANASGAGTTPNVTGGTRFFATEYGEGAYVLYSATGTFASPYTTSQLIGASVAGFTFYLVEGYSIYSATGPTPCDLNATENDWTGGVVTYD